VVECVCLYNEGLRKTDPLSGHRDGTGKSELSHPRRVRRTLKNITRESLGSSARPSHTQLTSTYRISNPTWVYDDRVYPQTVTGPEMAAYSTEELTMSSPKSLYLCYSQWGIRDIWPFPCIIHFKNGRRCAGEFANFVCVSSIRRSRCRFV
jgi:hypothetical protein